MSNEASRAYGLNREAREALARAFFPNYPDETQIARFFEVLGRAITVWQLVEKALYEIYERALAPSCPRACGASFHAIQTFNLKLNVANAAIRARFVEDAEKPLLEEWAALFRDANDKAKRRNQFAHFSTFIMFNEEQVNDRVTLEPPAFDWRELGPDRPKLRLSEIVQITERFVDLANALDRFRKKIPPLN